MKDTLGFLAQHGYWLLMATILARQACLPIPANLFLIAAGALARRGKLSLPGAIALSLITFLLADLAWYDAGRRLGSRVLHFLCGFSGDPESCASKATSSFSRHGVRLLLISKFVVGLDAVAAPLAGASRVPIMHFAMFEMTGSALWSAAYTALGYIFMNQLDRVAAYLMRMGAIAGFVVAASLGGYAVVRFVRWQHFLQHFRLSRISPEQLMEDLKAGKDILLVDLQGHAGSTTRLMALPGAVRINPRRLEEYREIEIPAAQEIILYCDCPGEFTSARVALALKKRGVEHVRPLSGGLQGWKDRGFPTTSEVRVLPVSTRP